MLEVLRFVQGAVAKKDFVPALTHFRIEHGTVRGFNGMLGLCSPIELDLAVNPRATQFIKAIQTCRDTVQLHLTPTGRLSVRSGSFKALVDCTQEAFPEVAPEGTVVELDGSLLKALTKLAPFIAEDASRPWARGILFRGQSAFATNNIVLLEYWLGYTFPLDLNIPKAAVAELIRIGEEPTSLQVADNSITFHFKGNRWLRSQLYSTEWPNVSQILDLPSTLTSVPDRLWGAIEDLVPFTDELGRLYLASGGLSTTQDSEAGASVEVPELVATGCFNYQQLLLLKEVATKLDLTTYPKPCHFIGDRVRGAIVGLRG